MVPDPPCDIQHNTKPRIVPIIANLCPQYPTPTKHEGLLEDPFPLIQSANAVMDPDTGQQLEYKQLINHPDSKLCQTWQDSSANEFGRLAQGVGRNRNNQISTLPQNAEEPVTHLCMFCL